MSEAENPELLGGEGGITVEDIRALAGPATPHFSLQIRNRIARLIEPFPAGHPVRLEGERRELDVQESRYIGEIRHRDASNPVAALRSRSATRRPSWPYG